MKWKILPFIHFENYVDYKRFTRMYYEDIYGIFRYAEHLLCGASMMENSKIKKSAIYYIVSTTRIFHCCNNYNLKRMAGEEKYTPIIRNNTAYIFKRHEASSQNLPPKPLDFIQTFSKYKLRNYNEIIASCTSYWRICVCVQI